MDNVKQGVDYSDAATVSSLYEIIMSHKLDIDTNNIWRERPVDLITFCRDWIREPLFDGPQEDFARDVIGNPTSSLLWDTTFKTILLAWGKGSGKGSLSAKLCVYLGYLLKLMDDPRKYFGIGKTAPIHLINVSYNSFQAKTVFFQGYLVPTVLNTINPKTKKNFFSEMGMDVRVNEGDILSNMVHFERPRSEDEGGITAVSLAGDRGTAEGFSPLLIFVDEFSAMQSPLKAEKLVDDLENSAISRFKDHYKLIIASFKQGRNCLMSMKVAIAQEKKFKDVYVSTKSTWEVNKLKKEEDFKDMYERSPVKSARTFEFKEIEGVDEMAYFKIKSRLFEAFISSDFNPFAGNVVTCRTDQLKILEFKSWFIPMPSLTYYMHIDLAKGTSKDRCGLALVHREGLESMTAEDLHRYIQGDYVDKQFRVKVDIILQLISAREGQIILEDIRQFIFKLVDKGFRIEVTLDGYNSLDFIQILNGKGIKAELLSVDRDKKGYDTLQSLIYRRNVDVYEHPILLRELEELEESPDGRKVDHPLRSLRRAKFEDNIDSGCFSGDTRIRLLDGTSPTLKELAENYTGGAIYVYTIKGKKIDVGVARNPRLTKRIAETVIVAIDNGAKIQCTPDHKFMIRSGEYVEARDLREGMSLMPLYTRISSNPDDMVGYEKHKNVYGKGWLYTHKIVGRFKNSKYGKGNSLVVHHKGNKLNNSPDNVVVMTLREHSSIHLTDRRKDKAHEKKRIDALKIHNDSNKENQSELLKSLHKRPEFREMVLKNVSSIGKRTGRANITRYNKSEKHRGVASEIGKKTIWTAIEASKKIKGADRYWTYRSDLTIDLLKEAVLSGISTTENLKKHFKCGADTIQRVFKDNGIVGIKHFREQIFKNHKVVSITEGSRCDVYDITVDETHNFALDCGVFVHNSKDVADALAGCCLKAVLSPSPDIPIMPVLQRPSGPKDEWYQEQDDFDNSIYGGLIPVEKAKNFQNQNPGGGKRESQFVPLFPLKG